jgi:hypothetical protein
MKAKDAVIGVLLTVILGQVVVFYLLLREFDRLKFTFEEDPVRVYVDGLTLRIRELGRLRSEVYWQAAWLSKRLDKCIEMLEAQKGLEPIPIEWPGPKIKGLRRPDPNMLKKYAPPPEPFYEPYKDPNNPSLVDTEERWTRVLMCQLALEQMGLTNALGIMERQIENFETRLARIDPNQP